MTPAGVDLRHAHTVFSDVERDELGGSVARGELQAHPLAVDQLAPRPTADMARKPREPRLLAEDRVHAHAAAPWAGAAAFCARRSKEIDLPCSEAMAAICTQYFAGMDRPLRVQDRTVTSATSTERARMASATHFAPPSS
ncbi:hypothetical protein ASD39_20375 [Sphingomonas sp. Root50]|nr:hypothetical protein ASD39_20375 [Sphingomonas sp. Root50]